MIFLTIKATLNFKWRDIQFNKFKNDVIELILNYIEKNDTSTKKNSSKILESIRNFCPPTLGTPCSNNGSCLKSTFFILYNKNLNPNKKIIKNINKRM